MKKSVSLLLCLLLALCLCGCRTSIGDLLSDFGNKVNDIVEKSGVLREKGIIVSRRIGDSEVKSLELSDVETGAVNAVYYAGLDKYQKLIYRYLLTASREMPENWFYCGKATAEFASDISLAYKAMLCDHPEIFWMPPSYMIAKSSGQVCVSFKTDYKGENIDYLMSREERDAAAAVLGESVNVITAAAQALPDDYEKELYVHDYLCNHARYNEYGGSLIYTSYGALVEGVCVCEGYSRAMQLLLQKLGIESILIYGEYQNEGHMWNCVNIGGGWYHVDVTWDKSEECGTLHGFFNLTDEQILADHVISPLVEKGKDYSSGQNVNMLLYECKDSTYNYFEYGDRYITDDINANAERFYADHLRGASFGEFIDVSSDPVDQVLSRTNTALYGRLELKSYSKYKNEVVVFFENTY